MAELSEKDRRIILGADYREIEEAAQRASGIKDADRERAAAIERAEAQRLNSWAFIFVGALLVVSNFYAASGPSSMWTAAFGGALCVIGLGWFWRQALILRRLRAEATVA